MAYIQDDLLGCSPATADDSNFLCAALPLSSQHRKVYRASSNQLSVGSDGSDLVSSSMGSGEFLGVQTIKLEKQDSSYYSDSENNGHSDISRNVSGTSDSGVPDNLGDCIIADDLHCRLNFGNISADSGYVDFNSAEYSELVAYVIKLGYSEPKLRQVVERLGTLQVGQDRLLCELMKLGQDVHHNAAAVDKVVDFTPELAEDNELRAIIIDGSNVAMTHGHKQFFSCVGIRECVQWFRDRGHTDILVFIPQHRKEESRPDHPITDKQILDELDKQKLIVWTPSRRLGSRRIVCYDDRFIVKTAVDKDAIIVSNDEYRDLATENAAFRKVIEERLLMYSFVDGKFLPPDDPLGRFGVGLDQFLKKGATNNVTNVPCPYGRKCTYGNKCKYAHPERAGKAHRSVTERLRQHAAVEHKRLSPASSLDSRVPHHRPAERTQSLNPHSMTRHASLSPEQSLYLASRRPTQHIAGFGADNGSGSDVCYASDGSFAWKQQQPADYSVWGDNRFDGHLAVSKQCSNPESTTNTRVIHRPLPPTALHHTRNTTLTVFNAAAHHPSVMRYGSTPDAPLSIPSPMLCAERRSSHSDSNLNTLGHTGPGYHDAFAPVSDPFEQEQPPTSGSGYFYLPSTTLWGPMENSVHPPIYSQAHSTTHVTSPHTAAEKSGEQHQQTAMSSGVFRSFADRSHFYYHMSSVFGEDVVRQVMHAYPHLNDPRQLGALICDAVKGKHKQH